MDCLFCKIINDEIPSQKVYEDDDVYAFKDINPQAPYHTLIIPKEHINSVADIDENNSEIVSKIFEVAAKIAKEDKLDNGFRVVTNSGEYGCQSVDHLHFHLLSGKQLSEKMC